MNNPNNAVFVNQLFAAGKDRSARDNAAKSVVGANALRNGLGRAAAKPTLEHKP